MAVPEFRATFAPQKSRINQTNSYNNIINDEKTSLFKIFNAVFDEFAETPQFITFFLKSNNCEKQYGNVSSSPIPSPKTKEQPKNKNTSSDSLLHFVTLKLLL